MCEAIDKKCLLYIEEKVAGLDVKNLEIGKWRYLTTKEVESLMK